MRGVPRPRFAIRRAASRIHLHAEDPGRPPHDGGEVVLSVEVQAVRHAEAVPQRAADPAGARRGADDGERLEAEPEAPRAGPLADHHVQRVVLHRRVEDLLDRAVEAVDLVDEQDVPLVQRGQDRGQVARALHCRPAGVADVDPELPRDDRGQRGLAEARRAVQEDVVRGLAPALGRLEQNREAGLDLPLADVLVQRPRAERALDRDVRGVGGIGREQAHRVVRHRRQSSRFRALLVRMFECTCECPTSRSVPEQRPEGGLDSFLEAGADGRVADGQP